MKLPFIEGGSFGSVQETVQIPEGELLLLQVKNFQPKATVIPIMLSGHCRVNSNWSLFMNSVLSPCFTGIVTLHSVLDCAVNSVLFDSFAGAGTVHGIVTGSLARFQLWAGYLKAVPEHSGVYNLI